MAGRKQVEPQWVPGFLASLARTGNARLAATEAGIDHTTAYQRRLKRPEFAEAWARALDERGSQPAAAGCPPDSRFGELVERVSANRGAQVVRAGVGRWSKRGEEAFLAELAASANVQRACAAAGFSTQALYKRRLTDRHFAEAWDAALIIGQARVEAYLIQTADRTFDPGSVADDAELPKMSVGEAIQVVKLGHAKSARSGAQRKWPTGRWTGPADWDDPDDEEAVAQARENIINRLQRMRENDEEEKLEAGWTRVEVPGSDETTPEHKRWTWVPPGFAPVVDCKALPGPEGE